MIFDAIYFLKMNTNKTFDCGCKTSIAPVQKKIKRPIFSFGLSVLIAIFPKCPLCWAAYMSILGSLGISGISYQSWMLPVFSMILGSHIFLLVRNMSDRGPYAFILSIIGLMLLLYLKIRWEDNMFLLTLAVVLITLGSILNTISIKIITKLLALNFNQHERSIKN